MSRSFYTTYPSFKPEPETAYQRNVRHLLRHDLGLTGFNALKEMVAENGPYIDYVPRQHWDLIGLILDRNFTILPE